MTQSEMLELIDLIYRAAEWPEWWHLFVKRLGTAFGSHAASFYSQRLDLGAAIIPFTTAPAEANELYLSYYAKINPFFRGLCQRRMTAGSVFADHQMIPTEEYRRTEFYNDFASKFEFHRGMNLVFSAEGTVVGNIAVSRSDSVGLFTETEVEAMTALVPHMRQALSISQKMHRIQALDFVLDNLTSAVVLISRQGRYLAANLAACEILDSRDGIALTGGRLKAGDYRQNQLLTAAVDSAIGWSSQTGGRVRIDRPSGKRPFMVLLSPVRYTPLLHADGVAAVAFLSDLDLQAERSAALVGELYQLTRSETEIAVGLAQGNHIDDLVAQLGVSPNTVRSHLKNIFKKTGVASQSDLMRLMVAGPIGIVESSSPRDSRPGRAPPASREDLTRE